MALLARFQSGENLACCARSRLQGGELLACLAQKRRTSEQGPLGQGGGDPDASVDATHLVVFRQVIGSYAAKGDRRPPGARGELGDGQSASLAPTVDQAHQLADGLLGQGDL